MNATAPATPAQVAYLIRLWEENRGLLGHPAIDEDPATVARCFTKGEASKEIDSFRKANAELR